MKVTMMRVNGESYKVDSNGNKYIPRKVLERNVMDMLEDNEYYGSPSFSEAEEIIELATSAELIGIYTETLPKEMIQVILNR